MVANNKEWPDEWFKPPGDQSEIKSPICDAITAGHAKSMQSLADIIGLSVIRLIREFAVLAADQGDHESAVNGAIHCALISILCNMYCKEYYSDVSDKMANHMIAHVMAAMHNGLIAYEDGDVV